MEIHHLSQEQRYNLLLSLALSIQTRANHFETYTSLDALIDLRSYYFIKCNPEFYTTVESLKTLTQLETLNLILDLVNQLRASEIQQAFSLCR